MVTGYTIMDDHQTLKMRGKITPEAGFVGAVPWFTRTTSPAGGEGGTVHRRVAIVQYMKLRLAGCPRETGARKLCTSQLFGNIADRRPLPSVLDDVLDYILEKVSICHCHHASKYERRRYS